MVPSDVTVLEQGPSIYVGGVGNVNVATVGGEKTVFTAVPAGTVLPVRVRQVFATSTTATLMVAVW